MRKISTQTLLGLAAVAGTIGYLVFGKKLKTLLKDRLKDLTAKQMSRDSGLSQELTRPAADLIID